MKKIIILFLFLILFLLISIFILNIKVTTRQGIDYKVSTLKIPLYLKILDFYDRNFNYKWLVHKITSGKSTDEDKALAIFQWVTEHIVRQPSALRVVDDHVWHIIVRGYGTHEQFQYVFATLCNYGGLQAFYARVFTEDKKDRLALSFVKIADQWYVFDPYYATYFVDAQGNLSDIDTILSTGEWRLKSMGDMPKPDYSAFLKNIKIEADTVMLNRSSIHSPINRLRFELKRLFNKRK
jgi:hypothetical protein